MSTMKNIPVFYEGDKLLTEIEDVPIPTSQLVSNDVLIKVAGNHPKDWKHLLPVYFNVKLKQGDGCAVTIATLGSTVRSFQIGERIAGFHVMDTPNGPYAEYAICPANTVRHVTSENVRLILKVTNALAFCLSDHISDEEAATTPLALYTAAVGSFAIKLAKLSVRVGPIIAIAGASVDYVKTPGVDAVDGYRSGNVAGQIKRDAGGQPIKHVFDAANSLASVTYLAAGGKDAVRRHGTGRYTTAMPVGPDRIYDPDGKSEKILKEGGLWSEQIWAGDVHETNHKPGVKLFGGISSHVIKHALADRKLTGQTYDVVEGGLLGWHWRYPPAIFAHSISVSFSKANDSSRESHVVHAPAQ